jgi:hypothetical protein
MEVHPATIVSTIAAAFKPRRAPARLPTSLACRLAAGWRIERVLISPRWRQPIDSPYCGSVLLDRDDPALAGNSDQDESPISAPVVWLALRRAELDCYAGYRPLIGRVAPAEDTDPHEHWQCQSLRIACATWPLLVGDKSPRTTSFRIRNATHQHPTFSWHRANAIRANLGSDPLPPSHHSGPRSRAECTLRSLDWRFG